MDFLLTLLSNIGYWAQVILAFGSLVVVHEFGHFIVAKWTGCRVDEFAVGFGPAIWQHQPKNSETLYALRWIPLGGYNRIWGYEDVSNSDFFEGVSEEEQKRAFVNRPIWARALVLVAGSTFNFAFAVILVAIWGLTVGFPYTEIGMVEPGSPADRAGIRAGDGVRNAGFNSRPGDISGYIGRQLEGITTPAATERSAVKLTVIDGPSGAVDQLTLVPEWSAENERPMVGIHMQEALGARLDHIYPDSAYELAGLKKGDVITRINGAPVNSGFQIVDALDATPGQSAIVEFRRNGALETTTLTEFRIWNPGVVLYPTGTTTELRVAGVIAGSAADQASLQADDIITAINGKPVNRKSANWEALVKSETIPTLNLSVARGKGETRQSLDLLITPEMVDRMVEPLVFNQKYVRVGLLTAIREGGLQTAFYTMYIWDTLEGLFQKKHEVSDLAGPIGIFTTSFRAAKSGAYDLMILMTLLTINLGIVNLLPFPALDGGRMIFLGLEGLFRRPVVDIRVENLIHVGGFLVLILLMLYVSTFDVRRLIGI